jgi:hypothetical protein
MTSKTGVGKSAPFGRASKGNEARAYLFSPRRRFLARTLRRHTPIIRKSTQTRDAGRCTIGDWESDRDLAHPGRRANPGDPTVRGGSADGWEYLLFRQLLREQMAKYRDRARDLKYGRDLTESLRFDDVVAFGNWTSARLGDTMRILEILGGLINQALPLAFGPDGQSGNANYIAYIGQKVGSLYGELILQGLSFRRVSNELGVRPAALALADAIRNAADEIEDWAMGFLPKMKEALAAVERHEGPITVDLGFTLTAPDDNLLRELEKLQPQ